MGIIIWFDNSPPVFLPIIGILIAAFLVPLSEYFDDGFFLGLLKSISVAFSMLILVGGFAGISAGLFLLSIIVLVLANWAAWVAVYMPGGKLLILSHGLLYAVLYLREFMQFYLAESLITLILLMLGYFWAIILCSSGPRYNRRKAYIVTTVAFLIVAWWLVF